MEILTDLQGLARAIRRDLGLAAGYSEHCRPERHGEAVTEVTVYAEIDGAPRLFQGSTHPEGDTLGLPALREALCQFVIERKREVA